MAQLFNRLLLATEGSDFDIGSERLAFAMAQRCQLPLAVVVPMVSNPEFEALAPQIAAKAEREAALKIGQLKAQAQAAHVSIELTVRRGEEPFREIVDEAARLKSELIIIRRRGKRGILANLLVGEMVSKVAAHARCHVLITPRDAQMWSQSVLVAVDTSEDCSAIVRTAAGVAAQCGLPLQVVTVIAAESLRTPAQATLAQWVAQVQSLGLSIRSEIRVGKPFAEILSAAQDSGADLIVMGTRGGTHIGRAIVGGVAQKVIGLSNKPVLILHQ